MTTLQQIALDKLHESPLNPRRKAKLQTSAKSKLKKAA